MNIWSSGYTRNNRATLLALIATAIISLETTSAQESSGPAFFANVNGGFGMIYGGFGGNLEAGIGHFSAFGSLGYATKRVLDTITIQPTINYHFGIRYYFNVNNSVLFPRIGVGFGWLTNYYSDDIGNMSYDQTVYGLSFHPGIQFYTPEGIVFSFDVAIGTKYTMTKASSHPYFYTVYARPTIGIGFDLTKLLTGRNKVESIRNQTINPFNP